MGRRDHRKMERWEGRRAKSAGRSSVTMLLKAIMRSSSVYISSIHFSFVHGLSLLFFPYFICTTTTVSIQACAGLNIRLCRLSCFYKMELWLGVFVPWSNNRTPERRSAEASPPRRRIYIICTRRSLGRKIPFRFLQPCLTAACPLWNCPIKTESLQTPSVPSRGFHES